MEDLLNHNPSLKSLRWVGLTSLPRVLRVREDNWLTREPIEELKTLRTTGRSPRW